MSSSANDRLSEPIVRLPVEPVPTQVNGFPVLAATKINARYGEYPDQWIVVCDNGRGELVVWDVYLMNDRTDRDNNPLPPKLAANNGYYTHEPTYAWEVYVERVVRRGIAWA